MLKFMYRWWWDRRRAALQWDLKFYQSGVDTYKAKVRETQARLLDMNNELVEFEYPAPRGVGR
jgi:hypothetical protein